MPGKLLTVASIIQCPHGGMAVLTTGNARTRAGGTFVLLESDVSTVMGCPFTIGPKYSPCLRIQWVAPAVRVRAGAAVLMSSSIGICVSPESAPQGVAIISNTQPKVSAQ
jgi:hypothetical protein